ncbi:MULTISPECIES: gamma-glutamyltransferase [unclassified Chelatococcus]|uniref:gamma-glutamyltransferase n=1 Tax=unclassified Chelatococcus TaxID=2638111 RepID=UPI001BCD065A|nr:MULTISPECIES: gamma-glutamyltransferase [unclassified Chelatococcus]MBS7699633.1 gamma-glutamyltransferase [Chelatococcus sp. YT9]MBX3557169.1 gamma-glutamyltransferase [Chelatococcus sp.]
MQTFSIHKPAVRSRHGLVAAQNRYAAEAGAAVLARGGNAMDAAIVTALVLSVVEPWLSGIGGGGFLLHADGATGEVSTLDFNVMSPRALDPADYPLSRAKIGNWFDWPTVEGERNVSGYTSMCVPGAIAGFAEALSRFGTLSWAEALQPAIAHAERGLEVDWFTSLSLAVEAAALAHYPASAALFLDDGRAPRAGDTTHPNFRPMPEKAELLKRLAHAGARDFYEGEVARLLLQDLTEGGCVIDARDLADYRPVWQKPETGRYRDLDIHVIPGLSGGPTFLDACQRLTDHDLAAAVPMADAALAYATAIRQAYEHRLTTMGHAATPEAGCTSHLSVVDAQGTMVSLTNTLLSRFGSKVVLPRSGILINNGVMWFDPRPGQPNSIKGGVKPLANMCPLIASRRGQPLLAIGAAGGRTIFPTVLQIISYMADRGLTLEEAFHTPRLDASTPTIRINAKADRGVAATVGTRYPVEIVEDTLYPVNFAVPSAVMREGGNNIGMAHPTSPWASVAVGEPDGR